MEGQKKRRGRPIKLTDDVRQELISMMEKNPLDYGLPYSLWDKDILKLYYDWKQLGEPLSRVTFQSVIEESKQRYGNSFYDANANNTNDIKQIIQKFLSQEYCVIYADLIYLGKREVEHKKPFYHVISTVDKTKQLNHKSKVFSSAKNRNLSPGVFCDYLLRILEEWHGDGYKKLLVVSPNKPEFKSAAKVLWEQRTADYRYWRIPGDWGYRWVFSEHRAKYFKDMQFSFVVIPQKLFHKCNFDKIEFFEFVKDVIKPSRKGVVRLEHEKGQPNSLIKLNAEKFLSENQKLAMCQSSEMTVTKRFKFLVDLYEYYLNNVKIDMLGHN